MLLNRIVKEEMGNRAKLLEAVADRILNRIFRESRMVTFAEVSVSKLNPPIGGDVEKVTIILSKVKKELYDEVLDRLTEKKKKKNL